MCWGVTDPLWDSGINKINFTMLLVFVKSHPQYRDVPCRAVPRSGGSVPCQIFPCRAQIFPCRALMIRAQIWRAEIWGPFLWKKRRLRQRTHKFRASRNMGAIFLKKKGACGNVVSRSGLPKNPKFDNSQNQKPFCPKCWQGLD